MPSVAIDNTLAIRETALLIPEAVPASSSETEFITVVVSGATLVAIPKPRTVIAGKKVVQYWPSVEGSAKRAKPIATIRDPNTRGRFAPYRSASPPDHRDSKNIRRMNG